MQGQKAQNKNVLFKLFSKNPDVKKKFDAFKTLKTAYI
jgi:hypothetical protein